MLVQCMSLIFQKVFFSPRSCYSHSIPSRDFHPSSCYASVAGVNSTGCEARANTMEKCRIRSWQMTKGRWGWGVWVFWTLFCLLNALSIKLNVICGEQFRSSSIHAFRKVPHTLTVHWHQNVTICGRNNSLGMFFIRSSSELKSLYPALSAWIFPQLGSLSVERWG